MNGFKPEIISAYNATWTTQNGKGLFDNVRDNAWTDNRSFYFGNNNGTTDYIELSFNKPFRIWRSGVNTYPGYNKPLSIKKKNGATYEYIGDTLTPSVGNTSWGLMTGELPAGTYEFRAKGGGNYHISSEWYVEEKIAELKVNIQ